VALCDLNWNAFAFGVAESSRELQSAMAYIVELFLDFVEALK
jgi:hypothetical protein